VELDYFKRYTYYYENHWWFRAREKLILGLIEALKLDDSSTVLDIGCGEALLLRKLARFKKLEGIEPEEGRFDFALVDGLIEGARQNNLRLIFLWFGSWKNGMSSYVPLWVKEDYRRFPRAQIRNGENVLVAEGIIECFQRPTQTPYGLRHCLSPARATLLEEPLQTCLGIGSMKEILRHMTPPVVNVLSNRLKTHTPSPSPKRPLLELTWTTPFQSRKSREPIPSLAYRNLW